MAVRVWREQLAASLVFALVACSGKAGQHTGDASAGASAAGGTSGESQHPTQPGTGSQQGSTGGDVAVVGGEPSVAGGGGGEPGSTAGAGGAAEDVVGIAVGALANNMIHESYGNVQLQVVLTAQPLEAVVVGLASADTAHAAVYPLSLTFTPENWSKTQTAIVQGVRDTVADGGNSVTIETLPAVSADPRYDGFDADDVEVYVIDETEPGIVVGPVTGLVTSESGGAATFNVVLTSQPTATVTIPLSSTDSTEGSVAKSVVFEPSEWSTPHPVMVTGVDDQLSDGNQPYQIILGKAVSDDRNYSGMETTDVSLMNVDNE